jgi:hypothetical protein
MTWTNDAVREGNPNLTLSTGVNCTETKGIGLKTEAIVGVTGVGEGEMISEVGVSSGDTLVEAVGTSGPGEEVSTAGLLGWREVEELGV